MPLGVEVGLGPRHIVLDGDPVPLPIKGAQPPNFRPVFVVADEHLLADVRQLCLLVKLCPIH